MKNIVSFSLALCLALLNISSAFTAGQTLRVSFLPVGYGDAILIEMPDNSKILIDTGSAESINLLKDFLDKTQTTELSAVMITQPHADNYGGLAYLLKSHRISKVYFNNDWKHVNKEFYDLWGMIKRQEIPEESLMKGDVIELCKGQVKMTILSPNWYADDMATNSISILLGYRKTSIVLTSGLPPAQQNMIAANFPEIKNASVIQIPQHGGEIGDLFRKQINKGKKKDFIVSTGENAHGKPLTDQWQGLNGELWRTDTHGMITIISDGKNVTLQHERGTQ